MPVIRTDFTYEHFCFLIESFEPFSLARYGDGEWESIFGKAGANCDRHPFTPALRKELTETLTIPSTHFIYHGIQPYAIRLYEDKIQQWLDSHSLSSLQWIDADVFHRASSQGNLGRWINALRERKVILAGPPHLMDLSLFSFDYVYVPPHRCHDATFKIEEEIASRLTTAKENTVVSLSASMAANGLVHRLAARFGGRHTILDMGSLWDPYVGITSRKYHPLVIQRLRQEEKRIQRAQDVCA